MYQQNSVAFVCIDNCKECAVYVDGEKIKEVDTFMEEERVLRFWRFDANFGTQELRFTPIFDEDQKVKQSDIGDYETEFYYNVMTGKVNIDTEWDNYVKRMNDLGLRELLDAATSQYLNRK